MHNELSRTATRFSITLLLAQLGALQAADVLPTRDVDRETIDTWSAKYRGWHYQPAHVIPSQPNIPGFEDFHGTDAPCVYQLPGQSGRWFMSFIGFIGFNGRGYHSFVAESTDLICWTLPRLAMGFGPPNEFDSGGCVIGLITSKPLLTSAKAPTDAASTAP